MRFAVCGYGSSFEHFHLPIIKTISGAVLDAAIDPVKERRELSLVNGFNYSTTPDRVFEVVRSRAIEAVVITSPNSFHCGQAEAALRAGAHVLVDKPVSVSFGEFKFLTHLSQSLGLRLVPFHNRIYDDEHLKVREIVREGIVGRLLYCHIQICSLGGFHHWAVPEFDPSWRSKEVYRGFPLYDWGPHIISRAVDLCTNHEEAEWTVSSSHTSSKLAMFDACINGTIIRCTISSLEQQSAPRLRAIGEQGTIEVSGDDESGTISVAREGQTRQLSYRNEVMAARPLYQRLLGQPCSSTQLRAEGLTYSILEGVALARANSLHTSAIAKHRAISKHLTITEVSDTEWAPFCLASVGSTVFHHPAWTSPPGACPMARVAVLDGGMIVAGAAIHRPRGDSLGFLTPYSGPCYRNGLSDIERTQILKKLIRELRRTHSISPMVTGPDYEFPELLAELGYHCSLWSTEEVCLHSLEKAYMRLSSTARCNIRAAERCGIKTIETDARGVERLVEMTFKRQGLVPWFDLTDALLRIESLEKCGLAKSFAACNGDGNVLAAVTIGCMAGKGVYIWGGLSNEIRHRGAMSMALWRGAEQMHRSNDMRSIDLEGSVLPNVRRFFRQFGSRTRSCYFCKPSNKSIFE